MGISQFVLASASPARKRLLETIGIQPVVVPSDFDESQVQSRDPVLLVQVLAQRKAERIAPKFESALVMGCDSVLAVNGQIHGKPANQAEAIARWQEMRGTVGDLLTKVYFANPSDDEIRKYAATGEPLGCAGAFALEGKGSVFVEKIDGCHSNVIGLSLPLLRHMLLELGYQVSDFWE
jgi:septum formation protein